MKSYKIIWFVALLWFAAPAAALELVFDPSVAGYMKESDYIDFFCEKVNGLSEVQVKGGRADCVNDRYAFEVEYANKWKEGITQSSWYAMQLKLVPALVLILRKETDERYIDYIEEYLYFHRMFIHIDIIKIY